MTELNVSGLRILVTGSAGFIGFHLSDLLLKSGAQVLGFDAFTDYYDVRLKRDRVALLSAQPAFTQVEGCLEDYALLSRVAAEFKPQVIVHLAAQAGVRYSLENPRAYIDTNIMTDVFSKFIFACLLSASDEPGAVPGGIGLAKAFRTVTKRSRIY